MRNAISAVLPFVLYDKVVIFNRNLRVFTVSILSSPHCAVKQSKVSNRNSPILGDRSKSLLIMVAVVLHIELAVMAKENLKVDKLVEEASPNESAEGTIKSKIRNQRRKIDWEMNANPLNSEDHS